MRKFFFAALICCITSAAIACGSCSSPAGGSYFGIVPKFNKNAVGLRWNHRSFKSPVVLDGHNSSEEKFNTIDLFGRYYPAKRVQLMAFAPFHFYERKSSETLHTRGLGDISVLAHYTIINTGDSLFRDWRHTLQAGGGVKFPTGKFNMNNDNMLMAPNMQPGSGSFDFLFQSLYMIRFKKAGMQWNGEYKWNTKNKNDYRFGNLFNTSLKIFYWQNVKMFSLLPNAGVSFETAINDVSKSQAVAETGGEMLFAAMGLEIYYERVTAGIIFQQPVYQNFAGNYTKSKSRLLLQLSFLF